MNEKTIETMRNLKFYGMVRGFKQAIENQKLATLSPDELVAMLIAEEWDDRHNRTIERTTRNAKFRYKAHVEQLNYSPERALDKNLVHRLSTNDYLQKAENIIITGSTGTGKSFLASALGHQACQAGHKVFYAGTNRLLASLKMAKADGSALRELARLERIELLILDDFGIQPLDATSRLMLMEIIEDRHGKRSTIFASQVPIEHWFEIIGDETIADAILDRVVHDAHRIELNGESMRKKVKIKSE